MILSLLISLVANAADSAPYPLFLKQGFSTVLEFEESPKSVVVGDSQSFQVERMEKSIVVRPTVAAATSNLFVYFNKGSPKLFFLTASDEATPTNYRKFENDPVASLENSTPKSEDSQKSHVSSVKFTEKKDYLTIEVLIASSANGPVRPKWNKAFIAYKGRPIYPENIWAERKEVRVNSSSRARFVFAKPDVEATLKSAHLEIPTLSGKNISFDLWRK